MERLIAENGDLSPFRANYTIVFKTHNSLIKATIDYFD
jgi:hypothetical protein